MDPLLRMEAMELSAEVEAAEGGSPWCTLVDLLEILR